MDKIYEAIEPTEAMYVCNYMPLFGVREKRYLDIIRVIRSYSRGMLVNMRTRVYAGHVAANVLSMVDHVAKHGPHHLTIVFMWLGFAVMPLHMSRAYIEHLVHCMTAEPILVRKLLQFMAIAAITNNQSVNLEYITGIRDKTRAVVYPDMIVTLASHLSDCQSHETTLLCLAGVCDADECQMVLIQRGAAVEHRIAFATRKPGQTRPSIVQQREIAMIHRTRAFAIEAFCDHIHAGTGGKPLPACLQRLIQEFADAYCKCISP